MVQTRVMKTKLTLLLAVLLSAAHAQDYLRQGDACYNQKDYNCAYTNYIKGYEAGMSAVKDILYARIGYCLNNMQRYAEAKPWFWRSLAEKNNADANWNLASAHLNLKNYDSSAYYYVRTLPMLTANESKRNVAYWAAASYFNNKKYPDAEKLIDESLKYDSVYISSRVLKGRIQQARVNYDAAITTFMRTLLLVTDSFNIGDLNERIGEVYYGQKKYMEAIPFYREAARYQPEETTMLRYIGDAFYNAGKTDSAELYYKQGLTREKAFPPADMDSALITTYHKMLINTRLKAKDTLNGLKTYLPDLIRYDAEGLSAYTYVDQLLKSGDQKSIELVLPLYIKALELQKRPLEAAEWQTNWAAYYERIKQPLKAVPLYKSAMAIAPAAKAPLNGLLTLLVNDKKYKEALDSLTKRMPRLSENDRFSLLGRKAELSYKLKDTVTAGAACKELLSKNLYHFDGNYYLGMMALERKDSAYCNVLWDRIRNANTGNQLRDNQYAFHRYIGIVLYAQAASNNQPFGSSYYNYALEHLNKALAIDSSQGVVLLYTGAANIYAKKMEEAGRRFSKALTIYQKKKDSLAITYRYMGFGEMRARSTPDFNAAINYYNKAIEANPKDSSLVNDLARVYFEMKDYTKAAEIFGKQIAMMKEPVALAGVYYNRAISYYYNKQKKEAAADVAKSLELDPKNADAKKLKTELEKPTG